MVADTIHDGPTRDHDVIASVMWILERCPACGEPTLSWWRDGIDDAEDAPMLIYPTARDRRAVPQSVRDRYESALRVKKIDPGSYAVGIRRMLEAVCNDHGIGAGPLFDRLNELAEHANVPETLKQQAHELRQLGNLGAHDNEVDVDQADVPVIEDFAEAVLEYLYRAPAKLTELRASLDERKAAGRVPTASRGS